MHEKIRGIAAAAAGAREAAGSLLLSLVLDIENPIDSLPANSFLLELKVRVKSRETAGSEVVMGCEESLELGHMNIS